MNDDEFSHRENLAAVRRRYDYRLTPYLASLLKGRAADDPVSLQFLPDEKEFQALPYEIADPIGDAAFSPVEGVVHRYPDRVLLKVAHACAVYCRFCFRREMVGSNGQALQGEALEAAIAYIGARPAIWEVILTGGDPLTLSARRLQQVMEKLAAIAHINVLRIHSRVPIVAPDSIDGAMLQALQRRVPVYLAVHVNHADEITEEVIAALRRIDAAGVGLLSQTVLLKGVNDDAAVLAALFRKLVRNKVRPYYLHHPDLAPGTSHFRVSIERGRELMESLRGQISGLCLPTYVLDIPGGFGKVPIGFNYVGLRESGGRDISDRNGHRHEYPE